MALDNAEVVRRLIEANRSDALDAGLETAIASTDPAIEFSSVTTAVEPRTYRGQAGFRGYFADMAESWREWRLEVEEAIDVGPDTVLAVFSSCLVGKKSGVAVDARRGAVFLLSEARSYEGASTPAAKRRCRPWG